MAQMLAVVMNDKQNGWGIPLPHVELRATAP